MHTSFKSKFKKKIHTFDTARLFIADKFSFNISENRQKGNGRPLKNERATRTHNGRDEDRLYQRPPDEEPLVAAVAEPLSEPPETEGESERPWKASDDEMETPV